MPPLSPSNAILLRLHPVRQFLRKSPPTYISPRCLSTSVNAPASSPLPSKKKSYTPLTHRRLVSLTGPDASTFLQGLTTTNITSTQQTQGGEGFYSAFLNAAGRVLYDVFIYPTAGLNLLKDGGVREEGFLIEVDAQEAQALVGHLRKFRLRRKVEVGILDGAGDEGKIGWGVHAVWGNEPPQSQSHGEPTEHLNAGQIGCIDARAPGMGYRIIAPLDNNLGAEKVPLENYHLRRILHGVPEGQTEIPKESALPLESNLDIMGGIDFRKGCYVGQELTIRTHHTGVVRKRILPVAVYRPGEKIPESLDEVMDARNGDQVVLPPAGADVLRAVGGRGRKVGRWSGGVGSVGLALCRLEVMTDYVVGGSSQFKPEEEFKVTWEGGEVMVKAFVPWWLRDRVEVLRSRHGA